MTAVQTELSLWTRDPEDNGALARVLAQGQDVVAIPGTERVKYVEENGATAGDRYPDMSPLNI